MLIIFLPEMTCYSKFNFCVQVEDKQEVYRLPETAEEFGDEPFICFTSLWGCTTPDI